MAETSKAVEDSKNKWMYFEMVYAQNFFYQERYFSTLVWDTKKDNSKANKSGKKNNTKIEEKKSEISKSKSLIQTLHIKRKQLSYPDVGRSAKSMLNVFDYFSTGLNTLYPNDKMSNKLASTLSESDNIYIMLGLHEIVTKVDNILQNYVTHYASTQNFPLNMYDNMDEVMKKIMEDALKKHSDKIKSDNTKSNGTMKKNTENTIIKNENMSSNINNLKEWNIDDEMKKMYFTEHKIDFIDDQSYICYKCNGLFSINPASHIIKPSHIAK